MYPAHVGMTKYKPDIAGQLHNWNKHIQISEYMKYPKKQLVKMYEKEIKKRFYKKIKPVPEEDYPSKEDWQKLREYLINVKGCGRPKMKKRRYRL